MANPAPAIPSDLQKHHRTCRQVGPYPAGTLVPAMAFECRPAVLRTDLPMHVAEATGLALPQTYDDGSIVRVGDPSDFSAVTANNARLVALGAILEGE